MPVLPLPAGKSSSTARLMDSGMNRTYIRIAIVLAGVVFMLETWRLAAAIGSEQPQQNVAAVKVEFESDITSAPDRLVVTNDAHEVAFLISDYKHAAYELGRRFLEANPGHGRIEIILPLPDADTYPWSNRVSYELRRADAGLVWAYPVGRTWQAHRPGGMNSTGPDE